MFDTFGNFDSCEEINACAAGLMEEGDIEHIKLLANENGLNEFMTQAYIEGMADELTDWMNAAIGKLDVEAGEYKNNQIPVEPVTDYLKTLCIEQGFAKAVRSKKKTLKECMTRIENKCEEIQKNTGKHWVADMTVFHWARDYYLEG